MSQISLSIIMPAYNVETFVAEAIESVLNQTVPVHELIVIDDGSTDATATVIARYADEPCVRLFYQSNQGLGPTRNKGVSQATGDYIHFLDADDLLDRTFVENMQLLTGSGEIQPDMVFFSGRPFVDTNHKADVNIDERYYSRQACMSAISGVEALRALCKDGCITACACLYITRTDHWHAADQKFPAIIYEDEGIIIDLILASDIVEISDKTLLYRRFRSGSLTTAKYTKAHVAGRRHNLRQSMMQLRKINKTHPQLTDIFRRRTSIFARNYIHITKALQIPFEKRLLLKAAYLSRNPKIVRKVMKHLLRRMVAAGPKI